MSGQQLREIELLQVVDKNLNFRKLYKRGKVFRESEAYNFLIEIHCVNRNYLKRPFSQLKRRKNCPSCYGRASRSITDISNNKDFFVNCYEEYMRIYCLKMHVRCVYFFSAPINKIRNYHQIHPPQAIYFRIKNTGFCFLFFQH